ncbi:Protein ccc1 [Emydomyces testavorans]|uniref:Protein ccc1 n=1 Tax=Emydomyces testavorans TaxID=2070801 RepID=A0AAF0DD32_9EURO|nr:Protein ccc1 [Emydomyces testavorans]
MALVLLKKKVFGLSQPSETLQERLHKRLAQGSFLDNDGEPSNSNQTNGQNRRLLDLESQRYDTFERSDDAASTASTRVRVSPRIVSDAILGLSDGLTVPFALSAGLSAFGNTKVVVLGGLAELAAGAISMGLGGYVGAKSEMESYQATKRETENLINASPEETAIHVREVFARFGIPEEAVAQISSKLHDSPHLLMDFLLTFHHNEAEPNCNQPWISALTLALGYFVGGFIPLIPYFCVDKVVIALYWSIGVMGITLLFFGYIKTCVVRGWSGKDNIIAGIRGGLQMVLVGGLAAGAAIALVRGIGQDVS